MKIIECGSGQATEGKPGEARLSLIGSVHRKQGADDIFIQALNKVLDYRFSLLHDVHLPGTTERLPLVLIGPTGIWVILASDAKGIYKIINKSFEEMDIKTGGFSPVKPNLVSSVFDKTTTLTMFLEEKGYHFPLIEPVVFFSNPGIHVELIRPEARIVLIDALPKFIATVLASPIGLGKGEVQKVVELLAGDKQTQVKIGEIKDAYSLKDASPPKPPRKPTRLETMSQDEPQVIKRLSKILSLSPQQWLLIGLLITVNIVILFLLIAIVIFKT